MESEISNSDSGDQGERNVGRLAYHNGRWVGGDDVYLSSFDPAVTQAVTAVERIRSYKGVLFELDRHLDRWDRTTAALSISGLPPRGDLACLIDQVIRRNAVWLERQIDFGVLLFATPGWSDSPTIVIDLYAIDSALVGRRIQSGSPLIITSVQQQPNASWSRNIKVRCRLHYYLADREAQQRNPEAFGVLVDSDGTVTDTSIANLLIVQGGRLISPTCDQVLQGVSLQVVRDLSDALGLLWLERRIHPDEMRAADEVLLTGTSCGIWFANSIDGSALQTAGPVYQKLRAGFESLVTNR